MSLRESSQNGQLCGVCRSSPARPRVQAPSLCERPSTRKALPASKCCAIVQLCRRCEPARRAARHQRTLQLHGQVPLAACRQTWSCPRRKYTRSTLLMRSKSVSYETPSGGHRRISAPIWMGSSARVRPITLGGMAAARQYGCRTLGLQVVGGADENAEGLRHSAEPAAGQRSSRGHPDRLGNALFRIPHAPQGRQQVGFHIGYVAAK